MKPLLKQPFILPVMVALGVVLTVLLVRSRPALEHSGGEMPPRAVETLEVTQVPFSARVEAFGNVEPAVVLESKAELSGKITYLHPELRRGGSIAAGTLVARIDPEDFRVSLKQSEADLDVSLAALEQLREEQRTVTRSLKLARENLRVGEGELARIQEIWEKRLIARAVLDTEEQKVLQLQRTVSELEGQLNAFNSRIGSEQARISRAREQVKSKQTALGRTEITLPFDARIGEVPVELGEFVTAGALLFEALNLDAVEINAQVPVGQVRGLVSPLTQTAEDGGISLTVEAFARQMQALNLQARVSLVGDLAGAEWEAKVLRFGESVDPTRRTIGIVVAVDKPYERIIPGKRPPLIKGMFTRVEVYSPLRPALVIPYSALHQGRVYLVDADNRLEIRPVEVLLRQGELAVIGQGLAPGEQLIINDLVPVSPGMPLAAEPNTAAAERLKALAEHGLQP